MKDVIRVCFNCESCGLCDNAALGELPAIEALEKLAHDILKSCKEYRKNREEKMKGN